MICGLNVAPGQPDATFNPQTKSPGGPGGSVLRRVSLELRVTDALPNRPRKEDDGHDDPHDEREVKLHRLVH